ncbi:hypothetical protein V5O48_004505 [Marasmius crinis-equi]|uniref:Uncharacterized protein n=1 Tax=Marasmius crinis-equi TaxID=585013 RepID=A0ABR3FPW0_9AGAR
MVQLNDVPPPNAPLTEGSSVPEPDTDHFPPVHAAHSYDRDRDTATTRLTLDYPGGLVVTTTVEVRLRHPHGFAVVSNVPTPKNGQVESAAAPPLPTYRVPLPTSFARPENEAEIKRFYIVCVGKEVGIFTGDYEDTVSPLVKGVPNNRAEGYSKFDDAVYQYARAYQGLRRGWQIRVVGSPHPVEFDDTYQWGGGEMLGSVDISGLDIDRALVSTIA